ncbi:UROD/MetE-like protein [Mytilinidion resinicola]|uniref:UROD/MetE-like protein n=1 Tax=Mytilinidion resinicola TaxID=574789 RepID=A0A6A6Z9F2_9PEZI|nr:UROD/MetE-like protein [Mytilinidion resinicola]KAF2817363.1 UROD/MetE-like protein [Mytilinidion resinicola]
MSSHIHRNAPFRAEHLGSLKRPQLLLDKRFAVDKNEAISKDLTPLEDQAIKEIVQTQVQLGLRAVSDGEYRRHMFWRTFIPGLDGFGKIQNPDIELFRLYVPDIAAFTESGHEPGETVICTGKIKHTGQSAYVGQVEYLKTLLPKERWGEMKLTLAAPIYGSFPTSFDDFCSEKMIEGWKSDKDNSTTIKELFHAYINFYNERISKAPAYMHIGIHLCRGNFVNSRHFSDGGYDRIATKLFRDFNVSTFYLEYDTPRAGRFDPLQSLPKNENVILGVITKRIYLAAEMIAKGSGQTKEDALKRLGVSPQCGFASHAEGNLIDTEVMKKKLALVRHIAEEIWPGEL